MLPSFMVGDYGIVAVPVPDLNTKVGIIGYRGSSDINLPTFYFLFFSWFFPSIFIFLLTSCLLKFYFSPQI